MKYKMYTLNNLPFWADFRYLGLFSKIVGNLLFFMEWFQECSWFQWILWNFHKEIRFSIFFIKIYQFLELVMTLFEGSSQIKISKDGVGSNKLVDHLGLKIYIAGF